MRRSLNRVLLKEMTEGSTSDPTLKSVGGVPVLTLNAAKNADSKWYFTHQLKYPDSIPAAYVGYGIVTDERFKDPKLAIVNRPSKVAARVLSGDMTAKFSEPMAYESMTRAFQKRKGMFARRGGSLRLVHGDGDAGLPGVYVDCFNGGNILSIGSTVPFMDDASEILIKAASRAMRKVLNVRPKVFVFRGDDAVSRAYEYVSTYSAHVVESVHGETSISGEKMSDFLRAQVHVESVGPVASFDVLSERNPRLDLHNMRVLLSQVSPGKSVLDLTNLNGDFAVMGLKSGATQATIIHPDSAVIDAIIETFKGNPLTGNLKSRQAACDEFETGLNRSLVDSKYDVIATLLPSPSWDRNEEAYESAVIKHLMHCINSLHSSSGTFIVGGFNVQCPMDRFDSILQKAFTRSTTATISNGFKTLTRSTGAIDFPVFSHLASSNKLVSGTPGSYAAFQLRR